MDTLTKLFIIALLILFTIIVILQYNVLREAAEKEFFEINYNENNFGSAGDIATIQQGDMNSIGAMIGLDDLDGTGTGSKQIAPQEPQQQPFPPSDSGKPDGSYAPGPDTTLTGDHTLGFHPINVKSFAELTHGNQNGNQYNAQGDINNPYTYYYLETDNINKPCKKHIDCPTMKCSESGFCKY